MGIISWMQNRFHGKTANRIFDGAATTTSSYRGAGATQETAIDEPEKHLDGEPWPQAGLLSIGTLGNEEPAAPARQDLLPEFTVEEVKKLQDALAMLLRRASRSNKSSARGSGAAGEDGAPPLDRFLNCPSCLEVDRRVMETAAPKRGECDGQDDGGLSPDTKIILTRARDLLDSGSVKQRSLKFLLKKMFACNIGSFSAPPPRSFKDPVESTMEKFFRTMIGKKKKMSARSSNGSATSRKYLLEDGTSEGKRRGGRRCGCQEEERQGDSCRWDRTDSEFIVLEI